MRTAGRMFLALAAVAGALAAGEGVVRILDLGPDVHRIERGMVRLTPAGDLRYELVPGFASPLRDVVVNAEGMRDGPVAREKAPGTFRIACVGDSIAFGMGTPLAPFDVQLEARLNGAGGVRCEVLNFGVPGYHVGQVAAALAAKAGAFAPDLVVYLYCLNDPQETSRELEETLRQRALGPARAEYVRRRWAPAGGGSRLWLLARLAAETWARRGAAAPREAEFRDDLRRLLDGEGEGYYRALYQPGPARERFEAGLDAIARWSREAGTPVWVAVVPVFLDLENYAFGDLHAEVARAAAARGLPVVDLLPAYLAAQRAGAPRFFADPLHPNAAGYGLAAAAVEDALRAAGALPEPAGAGR